MRLHFRTGNVTHLILSVDRCEIRGPQCIAKRIEKLGASIGKMSHGKSNGWQSARLLDSLASSTNQYGDQQVELHCQELVTKIGVAEEEPGRVNGKINELQKENDGDD